MPTSKRTFSIAEYRSGRSKKRTTAYAEWSGLHYIDGRPHRWFDGEGWREVTGPEEGAQRA
jgi:hypothetical protein